MKDKKNATVINPDGLDTLLPNTLVGEQIAFMLYSIWGINLTLGHAPDNTIKGHLPAGWHIKEARTLNRKILIDAKGQKRGSFNHKFYPNKPIQIEAEISDGFITGIVQHVSGRILHKTAPLLVPPKYHRSGYITEEYYRDRSAAISKVSGQCNRWAKVHYPHFEDPAYYWDLPQN